MVLWGIGWSGAPEVPSEASPEEGTMTKEEIDGALKELQDIHTRRLIAEVGHQVLGFIGFVIVVGTMMISAVLITWAWAQ